MSEIIEPDEVSVILTNVPTREQINAAERALAVHPGRVRDLPVRHLFVEGLYVRELTIPAGVTATGGIHKTEHLISIDSGDVTIWTEGGMKRLQGPCKFISYPGTKRIARAHTTTVITTYHVTKETDLAKIEAEVIEPSDNLVGYDFKEVIE